MCYVYSYFMWSREFFFLSIMDGDDIFIDTDMNVITTYNAFQSVEF